MLVQVLLLIVSLIPAILIFFYLRGIRKGDNLYRTASNRLLWRGVLCSLGVTLIALVLSILAGLAGIDKAYPLFKVFFRTFILAAFAEELVKYLAARKGISKYSGELSKVDVVAFFGIVAIGFDLIESVVYMFGSSTMEILVRGICLPHIAYGFIMGWFFSKTIETGKKAYMIPGFLIPFLLHGCYDFFLSEEVNAINEDLGLISLALVAVDLIIVIRTLFWIRKQKKLRTEIE